MEESHIPGTLDEAYAMRDASQSSEEWEFYQKHVYRLRAIEYRRRNVNIEKSRQRREPHSAEQLPAPRRAGEERQGSTDRRRWRWWRMFG